MSQRGEQNENPGSDFENSTDDQTQIEQTPSPEEEEQDEQELFRQFKLQQALKQKKSQPKPPMKVADPFPKRKKSVSQIPIQPNSTRTIREPSNPEQTQITYSQAGRILSKFNKTELKRMLESFHIRCSDNEKKEYLLAKAMKAGYWRTRFLDFILSAFPDYLPEEFDF